MNDLAKISASIQTPRSTVAKALTTRRREDVREAARQAIEKSWWRTNDVYTAWGEYGRVCESKGFLSLTDVLCDEYRNGKTYFEEAIDSGDPRTLRCLHRYIESGTYADGKIVRNSQSLHKVLDKESGLGFGYLADPLDTLYSGYTGQIRNGQRHGWGRFDYNVYDFYEGNWEHGERHGFGRVHRETPSKSVVQEAIFDHDEQCKNLKKTSSSKLDFFKRIKTMVFPF